MLWGSRAGARLRPARLGAPGPGQRASLPLPCRRRPLRRCRASLMPPPCTCALARPVGNFKPQQPDRASGPAAPPPGPLSQDTVPPFLVDGGTVDPDPRGIQEGGSSGTARSPSSRGPLRPCPTVLREAGWGSRGPVCMQACEWLCRAWRRAVGRRSPDARMSPETKVCRNSKVSAGGRGAALRTRCPCRGEWAWARRRLHRSRAPAPAQRAAVLPVPSALRASAGTTRLP